MLAGIEEAVHAGKSFQVNGERTAVETLLAGLIDYAGLYPPASLDMHTAVRNYLQYLQGPHLTVLGRFIVNLDRIDELRTVAADAFPDMPLSVILPPHTDFSTLPEVIGEVLDRASLECKVSQPSDIEHITARLPAQTECYFEIMMTPESEILLDTMVVHCGRAKLRMGGVVTDAFPSPKSVVSMLQALAQRHLAFKATAGLHHPVRSSHAYTDEPDSGEGMMHGFLNLVFAAMLLHYGDDPIEALHTLEEQDAHAFQVTPEAIRCRETLWSIDQLRAMREHFFRSFGSCSFEQPISDLEAMGWL